MGELRTIILAAGKGTRMKSSRPKVMHPICGVPLVGYVLDVAKAAGSLKTYVVVGYKAEEVEAYLGADYAAVRQEKLIGTADAVKCALDKFKGLAGNVLILCGDTPLLRKELIRALVARHNKSRAVCTVLTAVVHNPQGYGRIIRLEDGRAVAIREDKDADGPERSIAEINVGVYCVNARALAEALKNIKVNRKKGEFYLTDMVAFFHGRGNKIETLEMDNPQEGLGVNTRVDLAFAQKVIRKRILEEFMLQGVTIEDPDSTFIYRDVKIGGDTVVRPFTVIENDVRIGRDCTIGPFARLRPGSRLADGVEVGNFAEVSRTKIGAKSLMKHFSFLGDAVVGSQVNIAAGTITANYDGVNKNQTRIEDGAFIGCDAVLIAPVRIGKKAVVGAGSVVPRGKNVPQGAVAMGVPVKIQPGRKKV